MALTDPQPLGLFHGAIKPRGAYLSGPARVFAIWTVDDTGGIRFAAGPHQGAEGTITVVSGDRIVDGENFVLTHENPITHVTSLITFEFDDDSSVVETGTLRAVDFVGTETADQMRDLIIDAINAAPNPDVVASISGPGVVGLLHNVVGRLGAYQITDTVVHPGFAHTGMTWPGIILPTAPDTVRDFDVAVLTGDQVAVVYDNGTYIKYFVYDLVAESLIVDTTTLDTGYDPSMVNDGNLRTTYFKDNVVKMLTDLVDEPLDLVSSPTFVLREHDTGRKQPYVIKYLGSHSQSVDVALPIRPDVNSVFVHDCRDAILPVVPGVPATSGLNAYFSLDDNAADTVILEGSGSGVSNGFLFGGNNTQDISVPSRVNRAQNLDGTTDYIQIAHNALLQPPVFTVGFWFNANTSQGASLALLLDKQHGWADNLGWGFQMDTASGLLGFVLGGSTFDGINTGYSVKDAEDHHIIAGFDGANLVLWIDGVPVTPVPRTATGSWNNTRSIDIGSSWGGGSRQRWFRGWIDELRLYNRVLTQVEIDVLVEQGSPWSGYYDDKSANDNHLYLAGGARAVPGSGLRFEHAPEVSILDWDVPAFFLTMEALYIPSGNESRGRMLDGDLFMGYDAWGRLYWGYVDGGTTNLYRQTRLVGSNTGSLNHVAVTHQWGVAASTELFVNGLLVPGEWAMGTGDTDPALGTITSTVDMGAGDLLVQLSVNGISKANADIIDYVKGRL